MGSKNKLKRFNENETFANVVQPKRDELVNGEFNLKGQWNSSFFKNNNPLILELGCGKGEYTIGLAKKYPNKNFIGIDIKGARFWRGAKKAVDEYLVFIEKYKTQDISQRLLNPIWHVHNGKPPSENFIMPFSVLLNLVGTSNASSKEVLWKFVKKYNKNINVSDHPIFDKLVEYAIRYYNDIVKIKKQFKKPNEQEKIALKELINGLRDCKEDMDPEAIQTIVYSVGKKTGYKNNLREWFKLIYEVIFGDKEGPRMGFFISFFGVKETIDLINRKLE